MGKHKKIVSQLIEAFENAIEVGRIDDANKILYLLKDIGNNITDIDFDFLLANDDEVRLTLTQEQFNDIKQYQQHLEEKNKYKYTIYMDEDEYQDFHSYLIKKSVDKLVENQKINLIFEEEPKEENLFEKANRLMEQDTRIDEQLTFNDLEDVQGFVGGYEYWDNNGNSVDSIERYLNSFLSAGKSLNDLERMKLDIERNQRECLDFINSKTNDKFYYSLAYIEEIIEAIDTYLWRRVR